VFAIRNYAPNKFLKYLFKHARFPDFNDWGHPDYINLLKRYHPRRMTSSTASAYWLSEIVRLPSNVSQVRHFGRNRFCMTRLRLGKRLSSQS
jgi:hypothetical protein